MPESRFTNSLLGGLMLAAIAAALLIVLQILNWILGDPRWWVVIALIGFAGFLWEWRSRGQ